jgi:hypothetical protein
MQGSDQLASNPLSQWTLPLKAVHIQALDEHGEKIPGAFASGFISQEENTYFLYTCWHVVTGYDMHEVIHGIGLQVPPKRFALRVTLQDAIPSGPTVGIGGRQEITVPLYQSKNYPLKPLWYQDPRDVPQADLNTIGIKVPQLFDAIKIPLPKDLRIERIQIITDSQCWTHGAEVGTQLFVVGFPYGYSSLGMSQPTPIVLTQHVAATGLSGRAMEILLDRPGAPGMSGGPVFVRNQNGLYLLGIYTGIIYPDHVLNSPQRERVTALGICSNIGFCWGGWPLEPYRS